MKPPAASVPLLAVALLAAGRPAQPFASSAHLPPAPLGRLLPGAASWPNGRRTSARLNTTASSPVVWSDSVRRRQRGRGRVRLRTAAMVADRYRRRTLLRGRHRWLPSGGGRHRRQWVIAPTPTTARKRWQRRSAPRCWAPPAVSPELVIVRALRQPPDLGSARATQPALV